MGYFLLLLNTGVTLGFGAVSVVTDGIPTWVLGESLGCSHVVTSFHGDTELSDYKTRLLI